MSVQAVSKPQPTMTDTPFADPLEDLFVAHYADLVRLVSGLLDDNAACEEVVQDAFAAMLHGTRRPEPGKEAAYLRSAALNGARSRLRKRDVRRRRHLSALPEPSPAAAPAAELIAVDRLENEGILITIRALPARQAEVLLLRYQAELSELQIAETLGISPGSVKTHASRGLAAVRAHLEESR